MWDIFIFFRMRDVMGQIRSDTTTISNVGWTSASVTTTTKYWKWTYSQKLRYQEDSYGIIFLSEKQFAISIPKTDQIRILTLRDALLRAYLTTMYIRSWIRRKIEIGMGSTCNSHWSIVKTSSWRSWLFWDHQLRYQRTSHVVRYLKYLEIIFRNRNLDVEIVRSFFFFQLNGIRSRENWKNDDVSWWRNDYVTERQ